jgi:hypothetical protein
MYTNIDHDKGLAAVREVLSGKLDETTMGFILQLLEITLKNNDFTFNGEWYLQTCGTAMGVDYAPHYADIFMAKFEREALLKCQHKPHTFLRYLDDIFIIWPHSLEDFNQFLRIFNEHLPPIKFKATINSDSVDYLDTTVFKDPTDPSRLLAKVFFKPTDTHQLLHKQSFHPRHTFKGILKSQIIRFHRICSLKSDFDEACSLLLKSLRRRNYSQRWLRSVKAETLKQIALGDQQRDLCIPSTSGAGVYSCNADRCKTCDSLSEVDNFSSTVTGLTYAIGSRLTCDSSNIIYLAQCNGEGCSKQYIGETGNRLRDRMNQHRSAIMNSRPMDSALADHIQFHVDHDDASFAQANLETIFFIVPIEQIATLASSSETQAHRRERESFWIETLGTLEPNGLNKKTSSDQVASRKRDEDIIPFVVPYSRTANMATRIIRKHVYALQRHDSMTRHVMQLNYRIISAYSRHRNFANLLVSSKS